MDAGFCANVDDDGVLGVDAVGCCPATFAVDDVLESDGRWDDETCEASQFERGIGLEVIRADEDHEPGRDWEWSVVEERGRPMSVV